MSITIRDKYQETLAAAFESQISNSFPSAVMCAFFSMGCLFCMDAYKRDVVVVIKIGAYIHGCLFCVGAYYPNFTVLHFLKSVS